MKKVLIITYYWPPLGGAGVQRVLKFAKYLPEFGWQPVILTVENGDAPIIDESLLNDIPKECKVYKTKAFEPYNLYKKFTGKSSDEKIPSDVLIKKNSTFKEKLSNWIRLNLFIPDAKIGWIPFAVKEGLRIIEKEKIDVMLSSSPPHTIQIIAGKIARKSNIPWVADFRDPWLEMLHYQSTKRFFLSRKLEKRLEEKALREPNSVISISKDIINLFKAKVGEKNFKVIPNGFDETDFDEKFQKENKIFTIGYTGVLSISRIPFSLLFALKKIKQENGFDFRLKFAGKACNEFIELIQELELNDNYEHVGYLPHNESTKILLNSDVLLLVIDDIPNNKGFLTGKIFEYFACKKPIFAVGPIEGNANEILKETDSGKMVDYKDTETAYSLIKDLYIDWKNKSSKYTFRVESYSRKNLTKQLSKILEEASS